MKMDVIVLAGGFAKRMWPLTKDIPKHLLDIGGKTMLSYTLDTLVDMEEIRKIYVSTNEAFADQFEVFIENYPSNKVDLVVEPSPTENKKLGSIGGLGYLIEKKNISMDTMIIGGDNLFEFHPREAIDVFMKVDRNLVAVYDVGTEERARLYGVVETDGNGIIRRFLEKPDEPPSTLAATAFYIFKVDTIQQVLKYLEEGGKPDALGNFIRYIVDIEEIYAWKFDGKWFDIGSLEVYHEADEYFRRQGNDPGK